MTGHTRPHPYEDGQHGRSIRRGVMGLYGVAVVQCTRCPATGEVRLRAKAGPDIIDQKLKQKGWRLDPHVCPICQKRAREDKQMATTAPSTAAMVAQGRMHRMLDEHFEVERGRFAATWDDNRIAKETGLALDLVTAYRKAAFGELRVPTEVEKLQQDLKALEQLVDETGRSLLEQLTQLRARVAEVARKFPT